MQKAYLNPTPDQTFEIVGEGPYNFTGNDAKSGWCRIGSNDQNCTILVICVS